MATEIASPHDIFPGFLMGMVVGLGVTRRLSGLARIVQRPDRVNAYFDRVLARSARARARATASARTSESIFGKHDA